MFRSRITTSVQQRALLSSVGALLPSSFRHQQHQKEQQHQNNKNQYANFFFASGLFFSAAMTTSIFFFSSSSPSTTTTALCAPSSLAATIDEHHAKDRVQESYELSKQAVQEDGSNPEMLWRYGRALYLTGKNEKDKKKKEEFIRESVATLNKALELDSSDWNSHKWLGMALGTLGEFLSTTDKIKDTYKIKEHFDAAIKGNSKDATTWHCLGVWCFSLLQISWIERQVAATIFAAPPTTSFEDAEKALLSSHELDSDQPHNSIMLGDLYVYNSNKESARKWYAHAMKCTANTEYQKAYLAEAEKKLKAL